jgi:arylamine N-acetyltransferase
VSDISAYLNRINYHGSTEPTIETLRALHRAHLLAVPFENLDIRLTDNELIVTRNGQREEMPIEDEKAFVRALNEHFGIRII